ncbi:MAG: hypothetical protein E7588_00725 [Ruminococcaceae bacterium]|nr:hypothetical protein [Oscillospiraceae bacterium]
MYTSEDFTTTQLNIINAVKSLPRKQREVIVLYDVRHLCVSQIATLLGISECLAKKRLDRARIYLQEKLIKTL